MTSFHWLDAYAEDVFNSADIALNPENGDSPPLQGYFVNIECAFFMCVENTNPSNANTIPTLQLQFSQRFGIVRQWL